MACYRFGAFELETETGEIRRHGVRLKLGGQPFTLLQILVENAGRLVKREELKQALWAKDTYTDFDHGINLAVQRIRRVLGDSAQTPTFIETLPQRGYRFIAAVESDLGQQERPRHRFLPAAVVFVCLITGVTFLIIRSPEKPLAFTEHPLTIYRGSETSPAFSPEGTRAAFSWDGDICVKLIGTDSGDLVRLTTGETEDLQPAWSPDGTSIAFIRVLDRGPAPRGGRYALMVIAATPGGQERTLLEVNSRNDFLWPSWSPDNKHLVFSARPEATSGPNRICILSLESRELRFLTTPPSDTSGVGDVAPVFSPDGTTLAYFAAYQWGGGGHLFTVAMSEQARLASAPRPLVPTTFTRPAWTPDGKELIFCTNAQEGPEGVWALAKSGGSPPRLLWPARCNRDVAVTGHAGGMRVAYTVSVIDRDIMRVALAAPAFGQTAVLVSTTRDEYAPSFSPDGSSIAFLSDRSGTREIWVCDRDGTNQRSLAAGGGSGPTLPAWSPDGRQIAFQRRSERVQSDIFVVPVTGGPPRHVTTNGGLRPAWSRNGAWIYFFSVRNGINGIWRISPDGTGEERLTGAQRHGFIEDSADGKRLYFTQHRDLMMITLDDPAKPPVRVASDVSTFSVAEQGVYYLTPSGSLRVYDPDRGGTKDVMQLGGDVGGTGISVSPDGRWLLYARGMSSGTDVAMLENVR